MTITNNIEALRQVRGWSRPQLAERMATSYQQIERLEKGQRKLTSEWIEKAAVAFGVSPAVVISSEPVQQPGMAVARPRAFVRPAEEGAIKLKVVDLNLAMGDGGNLDDWASDDEEVEFDHNLLRSLTRSPPDRVIVARPRGDSMLPTIMNGDWVLIDTLQRTLNLDDKIWACSVYGAGALKRLKAIGRNRLEVRSDNPIAGNREVDAQDVSILGRAIWIGREV